MRAIKYVDANVALFLNCVQEKAVIDNHVIELNTAGGTGGSDSNGTNSNSHEEQQKAQQVYINELKAKIERLKAHSAKAKNTPRQYKHRD